VVRSVSAKALDANAVRLAVTAHIRHAETDYDDLLLKMVDRSEARMLVRDAVSDILPWRCKSRRASESRRLRVKT